MRWRPLVLLLFGFAASLLAAPPPSLLSAPAAPRVGSLAAAALAADPADSDISHRGGYQLVSLLPSRVVRLQGAPASWVAAAESVRLQDGNNSSRTNALGETTITSYHPGTSYVRSMTDPLGKVTTFDVDARGNPTRIVDAMGNETRMTYDSLGNRLSLSRRWKRADGTMGPETVERRSRFDGAGRLVRSEDATGHATTYEYNAVGRRIAERSSVTVVDPETGASNVQTLTMRLSYDAQGNLGSITDAAGLVTTLAYNGNGDVVREERQRTRADGSVEMLITRMEHDAQGRIIQTTLPDGTRSRAAHDARGLVERAIEESAPDGFGVRMAVETRFMYSPTGNLTETIHADGTADRTTFDAMGRVLTRTDRGGRTTRNRHDLVGRLIGTVYPDGSESRQRYDAAGRTTETTSTAGRTTAYGFDDLGRVTTVTGAAVGGVHPVTRFTHTDGVVTAITDAKGSTALYAYDLLHRRTHTTNPDGSWTRVGYDELGRATESEDADRRRLRYGYDPIGRLTWAQDEQGGITRYAYDEVGNRIRQTDARGQQTTWEFDVGRRQTARVLPGLQRETWAYDGFGRLAGRTDFNGITTTYVYDPLTQRPTQRTPGNGEAPIRWAYYPDGRRLSMQDATGTWTYRYDVRGRLSDRTSSNPSLGTVAYTWTDDGLDSIATGRGTRLDYTWDDLGRLATASLPGLGSVGYGYDLAGNLSTAVWSNGIRQDFAYDASYRLRQVDATRLGDGASLSSYRYTRSPGGHRTGVVESVLGRADRTVSWSYDTRGLISGETISGGLGIAVGSIGYVHDAVGNRLSRTSTVPGIASQTFTYDANDRPHGDVFDANGNPLQATLPGVGSVTDSYAFDNRLRERRTSDGRTVTIAYDGDGRKVAETVDGVTTWFVNDDQNPSGYSQTIEETRAGAVATRYLIGLDVVAQQTTGALGRVLFHGTDGHGSVRTLIDAGGAIVGTRDYDAFGELLGSTGADFREARHGFAGEPFIVALGQYYLRNRTYETSRGRMWTMDTIDGASLDPITLHKYLYANGNPVSYTDPSGNFSLGEMLFVLGTSLGLRGLNDGIAVATGDAITAVVLGVEAGNSLNTVLTDYALDQTGISAAIGVYDWVKAKLFGEGYDAESADIIAYEGWVEEIWYALSLAIPDDQSGTFTVDIEHIPECFTAGTPVATPDGQRPIETLRPGDQVIAWNEATGEPMVRPVLHTFDHVCPTGTVVITAGADRLEATAEHPFLIAGGAWVKAGDLRQSDALVTLDGVALPIDAIERRSDPVRVFNIEVEGDHTYLVGSEGIISHNAGAAKLLKAMGQALKPLHAAHHIVPRRAMNRYAVQARKILDDLGIDLDSAPNGVQLPSSMAAKTKLKSAATAHSKVHTEKYYKALRDELREARRMGGRAEVELRLQQIGARLELNKFPY